MGVDVMLPGVGLCSIFSVHLAIVYFCNCVLFGMAWGHIMYYLHLVFYVEFEIPVQSNMKSSSISMSINCLYNTTPCNGSSLLGSVPNAARKIKRPPDYPTNQPTPQPRQATVSPRLSPAAVLSLRQVQAHESYPSPRRRPQHTGSP